MTRTFDGFTLGLAYAKDTDVFLEDNPMPPQGIDLQFATNEQLIEELVGRGTFFGMVVWSERQVKSGKEPHKDFVVSTGMRGNQVRHVVEGLLEALPTST